MSEYPRVDHSFVTPAVQSATLSWTLGNGETVFGKFGVLAEEEDVRMVAKICFVSWIIGSGRKIVLGKRVIDPGDGSDYFPA